MLTEITGHLEPMEAGSDSGSNLLFNLGLLRAQTPMELRGYSYWMPSFFMVFLLLCKQNLRQYLSFYLTPYIFILLLVIEMGYVVLACILHLQILNVWFSKKEEGV